VVIREAAVSDAEAMSDVLRELVAAGKRTTSADTDFALSHYILHPQRLHSFVAIDDHDRILGFQSLKRAHDGNPYETPVGWGIIGTHVRPSAARMGVGSRLFAATLEGAREAELPAIEAYIGEENSAALAYYEALGLRTYRRSDGIVCKSYQILRSSAA
jgi:ribosomal protein S18 acetylase RimI-like enzyme